MMVSMEVISSTAVQELTALSISNPTDFFEASSLVSHRNELTGTPKTERWRPRPCSGSYLHCITVKKKCPKLLRKPVHDHN